MSNESAKLDLRTQALLFVWKSGAVKIFLALLMLVAVTCIGFSFFINPLITFFGFMLFAGGVITYFGFLLPRRPELFQDSQTWFNYQKMLVGNKESGLYLPGPESNVVQPIIQKNYSTKGKGVQKHIK